MTKEEIWEEIKQKEIQISSLNDRIKDLKEELEDTKREKVLKEVQLGNVFCLPNSTSTKLIVAEAMADVAKTEKRFALLGRYNEVFSAWSLSLAYGHSGPYTKEEIADYILENGWVLWGTVETSFKKIGK